MSIILYPFETIGSWNALQTSVTLVSHDTCLNKIELIKLFKIVQVKNEHITAAIPCRANWVIRERAR